MDQQPLITKTIQKLDGGQLDDDISTYVRTKLSRIRNKRPHLDAFLSQDTKNEHHIVLKVQQRAEGMLRYVQLLMKQIKNPGTSNIRDLLERMPTGLFGMYEDIISRLPTEGDWPVIRRRIYM